MTEHIDMSKVTLGELVNICSNSQCLTCKFNGFCEANRLNAEDRSFPCYWDLEAQVNKNVGKDNEFYKFGSYNDWPKV